MNEIKKQYGLQFYPSLIAHVDRVAEQQSKNRTEFVTTAIRNELNRLKVKIRSPRPIRHMAMSDLENY